MSYPVSVIVPHKKTRSWFFQKFCLPSIRINNPEEILIEEWEGGACEKRNSGAFRSRQPYLLFVDDDTILREDFLEKMVLRLHEDPGSGYAYCDYASMGWPGQEQSERTNFEMKSRPFDPDVLRMWNYIDTTSLIRRDVFPSFDPGIKRLQDWDLWLSLLARGVHGTYIPETLFMKFSVDVGISQIVDAEEATSAIAKKHGLTLE